MLKPEIYHMGTSDELPWRETRLPWSPQLASRLRDRNPGGTVILLRTIGQKLASGATARPDGNFSADYVTAGRFVCGSRDIVTGAASGKGF